MINRRTLLTFKLASTMLGDNPEKSRNPLKKAMRRRNAKTVTFSDPTYYDPSENEFSSGDEGDEDPDFLTVADVTKDGQVEQEQAQNDTIEPLRIRTNPKENTTEDTASESILQQNDAETLMDEVSRASSETYDQGKSLTMLIVLLIVISIIISTVISTVGSTFISTVISTFISTVISTIISIVRSRLT